MIVKLIVGLVVSGLIAIGVVMYMQYSDSPVPENADKQFQNTSDVLNGAKGAVEQTQDLQNNINSKAQDQTGY